MMPYEVGPLTWREWLGIAGVVVCWIALVAILVACAGAFRPFFTGPSTGG